MTAVRWRLAWLLVLPITWIMSLDRTAMTVAAPIIQKEMGFSLTQMSFILTAFHWAYALLSVPAGLFAAWAGARVALLIADAAWSALTLAIPFAPGVVSLTGLRLLLGGFQAVDMPASVSAFRAWFPRGERARANSALLAGVYLGPIAGAPVTVWLVAGFGWRAAFIVFGLLGLVSALAWWRFFRDDPGAHPAVGAEERALIAAGRETDPAPETAPLSGLVKRLVFWTVGLQGLCTGVIMGFFNTWLPTYLMQARGVSLKGLGFFASLPWMILLLVVFAASALADHLLKRTGSLWLARIPAAVCGYLIAGFCLFLVARTAANAPALALLAVGLGGMGFVQASTWVTMQEVGGRHTSLLTAWNGMVTNGGAAIGPMAMAMLASGAGGWDAALTATAGVGVVGAVAWTMIHPRRA